MPKYNIEYLVTSTYGDFLEIEADNEEEALSQFYNEIDLSTAMLISNAAIDIDKVEEEGKRS
jgi:hypothetical protein